MSQTDKKLDTLINAVEKLIAKEVAPIAPVLPIAPIAPIAPVIPINPGDHDLIVGLVKDVTNIQVTVNKLAERDETYVSKVDFQDHEIRIRFVEKWMWIGFGLLTAIQIAATLLSKFYK